MINDYRQLNAEAIVEDLPPLDYVAYGGSAPTAKVETTNLHIAATGLVAGDTDYVFCRVTKALGSEARQARRTDLRTITTLLATSFVNPDTGTLAAVLPMNAFTLEVGDRVGIHLQVLSVQFFPGGSTFVKNVGVTAQT